MMTPLVEVTQLRPELLEKHPVWDFAMDQESRGDTLVRPVSDLPVDSIRNRVVGVRGELANGRPVWLLLQNLNLEDAGDNECFKAASFYRDGRWFHLARPDEPEWDIFGPEALAEFLGLSLAEVFPVRYDLSRCCRGLDEVLHDTIEQESVRTLTADEVVQGAIAAAMESDKRNR
jgi:hypothetical protein